MPTRIAFPFQTFLILLALLIGSHEASAATYWVSTTGSDSYSGTSQEKAWRTLKYACARVAPDQGHVIRMSAGTFLDNNRLTGNASPAVLPQGVSLIGAGKTKTVYKGQINVPRVKNQEIAYFHIDGRENTAAATPFFSGLMIETGSGLKVNNLRIEGFHSMGLQFGKYDGLSQSTLQGCDLVNNGKHNARGFGMRTGNMTDCQIFSNQFIEQRGKGGEVWNSGNRTFTNVKIYNNTFTTHNDSAAGWNGQQPFNFELWRVDCLNVEVYKNKFDGSVSLVDPSSPRTGKTPFSIRLYDNTWSYTKRYAIEASMAELVIDHNYFHFGVSDNVDIGRGYGGIVNFGDTGHDNIRIHRNVFDNVPLYAIHNLTGNNIQVCNNTVLGGRSGQVPKYWNGSTPRFMTIGRSVSRSNWRVVNNVFDCDPARPGVFVHLDATTPTPTSARFASNVVNQATSGLSSALLAQSTVKQVVTAKPGFVASGVRPNPYFQLSSTSPLIDAGVVVAGITDGYQGKAPDIGAYESAQVGNLLTNPGFEQKLTGWGDAWISGSVSTTSDACVGAWALRVGSNSGIAQNVLVKLAPHKTYRLSAWGRRTGSQWSGFGVILRKNGTKVVEEFVSFTSSSWQQRTVYFTTPSTFDAAEVWVWCDAGGYLWIDQMELVEVPGANG